jgi:hypothetical protein
LAHKFHAPTDDGKSIADFRLTKQAFLYRENAAVLS